MAMNVRIPEELDRQLDAIAAASHTSKNALLLQGAALIVEQHARRNLIDESLQFVKTHDAELLKRLEDA
ncbi:toxin-antitoxin system HicB family antitoxin [Arthrobacter sp. Br18]|uniref:toxin-antitoxin system HicB family antitoxin n=1 Tax=Arthrobacter sp. Br18 TaxID=1312954 RepID=UPI0004AE17B6|nr:toxin-antitoxin system HicB family antitoxin [Arthrobacter sp. Br18]